MRSAIGFGMVLVICLVLPGVTNPASAATFLVTNTNDSGAGSLRAAVATAATGDTITFNLPGCPCTITLVSGELPVANGITIQGPGALQLTISGNQTSRIFNVTSAAAVTMSGMTLQNGKPNGGTTGGGAILLNGGAGAPAYSLTDMTVTGNDVTLTGNPLGGGIDNEGGTVTITRCSIVNNTATFRGGGIQNQGSGSMTIVDSTIAGNTAGPAGIGGGIRTLLPLTVTYVTLFGNSANSAGNLSVGSSLTTIKDTIIAGGLLVGGGTTGPDAAGTIDSLDYNLIQNTGGATVSGTTTHNIIGVSPLLGPLQNNGGSTPTLAPLAGSPVLDAGSAAGGVTVDQRGLARVVDLAGITNAAGGNGSDIGSVESQSVPGGPATTPAPSSLLLLVAGMSMIVLWRFASRRHAR
jgi:hypothetical protein